MTMKSKGFTLIELMVVLLLLGLLAALLYPALSKARENGRRAQCANNLKELHSAITSYIANSGGRYPLATTYKEKGMDDLYYEQRGWVGPRTPMSSDAGGAPGDTDMWDDTTCKGTMCITNGTLFPFVTDKKIYLCPTFALEFGKVKKAVPVRSYVMNWELNGGYLYSLKNGSRLMLFTEVNVSKLKVDGKDVTTYCVTETGGTFPPITPGSPDRKYYNYFASDGALMVRMANETVTPTEGIAAYHNDKGNVIFADGHIEYLSYSDTYLTGLGRW